jgi:hypothetical protein
MRNSPAAGGFFCRIGTNAHPEDSLKKNIMTLRVLLTNRLA